MNESNSNFKVIEYMHNTYSHNLSDVSLIYAAQKSKQGLPYPPLDLMQYGEVKARHIASGRKDFKRIIDSIKKSGIDLNEINKIFELGCANCRILRHFEIFISKNKYREAWGSDINSNTINWAIENLSPPFNLFVNTTQPHIPMVDEYFDLIYAYSVFTHIGDLFTTWLLELKRILNRSKYLYISIHDENSIRFGYEHPQRKIGVFTNKYRNLMDQLLDGKVDFLSVNRENVIQVYVRREYICNRLSQWFDILQVEEYTMGNHQTALLLKKK